jgi:hypothetical protein
MGDKPSARARLRAWIRGEIKDRAEVSIKEVQSKAIASILKDRAFLKEVVEQLLSPLIYEEIRLVVSKSREHLILGDEAVTREALRDRASRKRKDWGDWLEHAGTRHVLLMEMTPEDLEAAEAERRKRGDSEYELADLWAALRSKMEDDQRVKDVFTPDEIERVRLSLKPAKAA